MAEAVIEPAGVEREDLGRQRIPLIREMGFWAIFVFAASGIGLTYSGLLPFSTVAGLWPGSNLVGMLAIALLLALIHAYTYAVIGTVAPRYGADYLVASRVISPSLAFASSFTLVVFLAIAAGSVVSSLAQSTAPMFLQILSLLTANKGLLDSAGMISSANNVVMLGTAGVVLLFLILILPPRWTRRLLAVALILALAAWVILFIQMATAPAGSFQAAWNQFMGEGNYQNHLEKARELGMQVNYTSQPMVLAGLILGFWMFYGYFNPSLFAAEVKKPGKNLLFGSWTALLVSFGVLALAVVLLQRLVPIEWLSAESYLSRFSAFQGVVKPWIPLYASILSPSPLLLSLVGLSWLFGGLALAHTFLYTGSRVILAWAEDRVLPEAVGFMHPELHSPLIAVLLVAMMAEIGVVDAALSGNISSRITPVFFMAFTQILPVLGVTLLPFIKRAWFEGASVFARRKIGPIPLVTVFGVFSLVYLIWMIVATLLFPGFGQITPSTLLIFATIFVLGLAWFFGRRFYLRGQSLSFDATFQSAPEEALDREALEE